VKTINCERCGKTFNSSGFFNVCPVCTGLDEQDFLRIKEYLYEHPGAKLLDVVTDLNIPVRKIKRYLRENRLEILEKNNRFLFCEMCGKPIRSGQFCDTCYKEFHRDYNTIYIGAVNSKHTNRINLKPSTDKTTKMASSQ